MRSIKFIDSVKAIHYTTEKNGKGLPHNENGPAWQHENDKEYFVNGKRHRVDGPAVEHEDGHKEWFINGIEYTKEEFQQWLIKKEMNEKLKTTLEPKHKEKKKKI